MSILLRLEIEAGPNTLAALIDIANSLDSIVQRFPIRTLFITKINFQLPKEEGATMFSYAADKPDFSVTALIEGVDTEGGIIPDVSLPAGISFVVTSSDEAGVLPTPDPLNPKHVSFHQGSANADGSNRPVTITARLVRDADGSDVFPPIVQSGEVTPGGLAGITRFVFELPTS